MQELCGLQEGLGLKGSVNDGYSYLRARAVTTVATLFFSVEF